MLSTLVSHQLELLPSTDAIDQESFTTTPQQQQYQQERQEERMLRRLAARQAMEQSDQL